MAVDDYLSFRIDEQNETIYAVLSLIVKDEYYHVEHRLLRVLAILEYVFSKMSVKAFLTFYGHSLEAHGDITALNDVCINKYGIDIKKEYNDV